MAMTPAEKQKAYRQRIKDSGKVEVRYYVYPEDVDRINKYIDRISREQGK